MTTKILPTTAVPVWLFAQNADGTLSPATAGGGSGVTSINTLMGAVILSAGSNITITLSGNTLTIAASSGNPSFSALTSGTNTTAAMIVGTGASLASTPQFNIGAVGTTGVLGLNGSTSGTATFTAPAVAGTSTNPVVMSNGLMGPANTAASPTYGFTNNAGLGVYQTAGGSLGFVAGSANVMLVRGGLTGAQLSSSAGYLWSSNTDPELATFDTGLGRSSAGVVSVDTTSIGNGLGTITATGYQAGGTAGVTAGSFSAITAITTKAGIVTQLTGSSDERLKTAKNYEGGLSEILAITPVSYRWNEKGQEHTGLSGEQEYVGFLAQDVQKVIPQAITATEKSKDGSEEYLSFDDRPVVAALVNAVKQLAARVQELEARLEVQG